jgi:hypothetical protein
VSQINNPVQPFKSADEIEEVVRRFEACAFQAGEFKHREHLAVILWYLSKFSETEAAARMREGLYRFLDHHKVDRRKYHETITLFWVRKVRVLLAQNERELPLALIANKVIEDGGDVRLIYAYYSEPLINSTAAREGWVEPDLQPLDF